MFPQYMSLTVLLQLSKAPLSEQMFMLALTAGLRDQALLHLRPLKMPVMPLRNSMAMIGKAVLLKSARIDLLELLAEVSVEALEVACGVDLEVEVVLGAVAAMEAVMVDVEAMEVVATAALLVVASMTLLLPTPAPHRIHSPTSLPREENPAS